MSYELNKQDILDFVSTLATEKRQTGKEMFFRRCPYCNGGGHDDWSSSINLDTGAFHCFRSGCSNPNAHFVQLARDFGFHLESENTPKQYKRLPQREIKETPPAAVTYLESRGISKATAEKYKITVRKDNPNILVFPFYNEMGQMEFVKYRNTKFNGKGNKEFSEKDAKPILFGMMQCEDFSSLVITEGQIDSLSCAECGIKNSVSVPNGSRGFTWYQHCAEWLDKFQEIIVFGDNENGHITLVDELQARVKQRVKVVRKQDYLMEKDANAILQKYGKQAVIDCVKNAEVPKLKNVIDLADVEAVDLNSLPKIKTGITPLDRICSMTYGSLTILSGKRGSGKSTLASAIMCEALDQGLNVFAYSGELEARHFRAIIDSQLAGRANMVENINEFHEPYYTVKADVLPQIANWYRGRAFLYDNSFIPDSKSEEETLIDTIEKVIRTHDTKLIIVDNMMTAMEMHGDDLYNAQSQFVTELKKLAMRWNVAVLLLAHPRKTKDGEALDNDSIMGSGDVTNRADNVLIFLRGEDGNNYITVNKNRLRGKLATGQNAIIVNYSASCRRLTSVFDSPNKCYGWERKDVPEGFEAVSDMEPCPF